MNTTPAPATTPTIIAWHAVPFWSEDGTTRPGVSFDSARTSDEKRLIATLLLSYLRTGSCSGMDTYLADPAMFDPDTDDCALAGPSVDDIDWTGMHVANSDFEDTVRELDIDDA